MFVDNCIYTGWQLRVLGRGHPRGSMGGGLRHPVDETQEAQGTIGPSDPTITEA